MTQYAKIKEDGSLEYAQRDIPGISNWIEDEAAVLAAGYLPVSELPVPEGYLISGWKIENGEIVAVFEKIPDPTKEQVEEIRKHLYIAEVDPLMAEYNRKKLFNLFEEGEEETLLNSIEEKVAEIKEKYPKAQVDNAKSEEDLNKITW